MKKIFRTVTALAVVMFAGCTNDLTNDVVAPVGGKTTVELGLAESRTYIGEAVEGVRKVYWSKGDQVAINGVISGEAQIDAENASRALFDFESELTYPYSILYPAEMYKDASTITLAAVQEPATGTFDVDLAPMATYVAAEGTKVVLHHLAAVVRLQIKSDGEHAHNLKRIELRGNKGEQVSGDFTIDYENATLTPASTADADKVVVAKKDNALSTEEAVEIFVVVPAQEYAEGFSVRIFDNAGHYMDLKSKAITLEKGQILAMPVVEFTPTGTIVDAEISIANATEWNAFVQEYNQGIYKADTNTLIVNITGDLEFDDTTNAAFATLGGTEAAPHFYGTINGNSHAFKNLVATSEIIKSASNSTIKDITIDVTCKFTASGDFESDCFVGSLAENIYASTLENIVNKGTVVTDTMFTTDDKNLYVGGIVARTDAGSKVINCQNTGKVETDAASRFGNAVEGKAPSIGVVYHGGIIGYNRGIIEGCTNTGRVISAFNVYSKAVGGITGRSTGTGPINNCKNTGYVIDNSPRKLTLEGVELNDFNRKVYIAGIVGISAASITNCRNEGEVTSTSSVKDFYMAGILALVNADNITFANNSNVGDLSLDGAVRYPVLGGLIGSTNQRIMNEIDLAGCDLKGTISAANHESSKNYPNPALGGAIGEYLTPENDATKAIVIKNGLFEGTVTRSGDVQSLAGYMGSIIGYAHALDISNCTNQGTVTYATRSGSGSKSNGCPHHVGGIVGYIHAGTSSITNCHNEGDIKQWHYNNGNTIDSHKSNTTGGILGSFGYVDATGTITISQCSNSGSIYGYRGMIGGLAGFLANATVSNCTIDDFYADSSSQSYAGGIAGSVENSTLTSIVVKSKVYSQTNGSEPTHAGGLVAYLAKGSKLSNCSYYGDVSIKHTAGKNEYIGGLAAEVQDGTTIENCKLGGTVDGEEISASNFADYIIGVGSESGTNGNATITGCTYWNGN